MIFLAVVVVVVLVVTTTFSRLELLPRIRRRAVTWSETVGLKTRPV